MRVDLTDKENIELPLQEGPTSSFGAFGSFSRKLADLVNSPLIIVYAMVLPVTLVAWIWLFLAAQGVASSNAGGSLGPSMQLFEPLLRKLDISTSNEWVAYLISICSPASIGSAISVESLVVMFLMWLMMAIAMMLPTAAPMLRSYAGIADTAARKGEPTVPLWVLAAGYLAVWVGFSLQATLIQAAIIATGRTTGTSAPVIGLIGGLILILAGLYQFSPFKKACLVKCRNPFTVLLGQWGTDYQGVFKLGLQQGVFCLGCCWALMLVMLSVGTMNLVWMAALTLFTLWEKTGEGKVGTRVLGTVLLAWGLFLVLNSANLSIS